MTAEERDLRRSVAPDRGTSARSPPALPPAHGLGLEGPAAGDAAPGDFGYAGPVASPDFVVRCKPRAPHGDHARCGQPIPQICFVNATRWAELQRREGSPQRFNRRNTAGRNGGKELDGLPVMLERDKDL